MADIDEDDAYSDDDLDALASDELEELQQHALLSAQQPPLQIGVDLQHGDSEYKLSQRNTPYVRDDSLPTLGAVSTHAQSYKHLLQPSSDYGDYDLDDEVLDGGASSKKIKALTAQFNDRGATGVIDQRAHRESWRQQRYSAPIQPQRLSSQNGPHVPRAPRVARGPSVKDSGYDDDHNEEDMLDAPEVEEIGNIQSLPRAEAEVSLEVKVAELLREREALQQAVRTANDTILAKTGEISIVRANQVKTSVEHDRQMAGLRKLHIDEVSRQKAELDIARKEKENIITENRYLKHDLTEESERAKQLERAARGKIGVGGSPSGATNREVGTTPMKSLILPYRDGFNDDEIVVKSPSKGGGKTKATTPKAGAKRKRKVIDDSPGQPLQINQPRRDLPLESIVQNLGQEMIPEKPQINSNEDQRFQITQRILNHRIKHNEKRTFETLINFTYPSEPAVALSSLFLDKLASISFKHDMEDFFAASALIVTSLWSRCVEEKYYQPLYLLIDLVKFILVISPFSTASYLADDLVLVTQLTADINVIPRMKRKSVTEITKEIDTNECLQILYLTACGCARRSEDIQRFWRSMRFDFVFMLLDHIQPIEDIEIMLDLLRTSTLEDSFAMRVGERVDQSKSEGHIIDKITALLLEVPRVAPGEQPYDTVEIAELRLEVLALMEKICDNQHGGEALARNKMAIGRLVRVMNDELSALYHDTYGYEHRSALINVSTRLLYHLLSAYAPLINISEKLATQPGGANKFLLALTRLAFVESTENSEGVENPEDYVGVFYERGIEADVSDCAHEMLENYVTPEEGEALCEAFSSSRK